ncbi:MAG: type II toxin-antitoxin system CcdA family antitoxin [Desulfurococcales archaeon]|nr:type II toxin-antitoxin system CcdA family antitoxin [Desulfurococcales archaeon]
MGSYVTVSTKVRREVVERARRLGINISEFLRKKLEEEVESRELELLRKKLEEMKEVLEKIDIDRIVQHIREDRETRP